MKKEILIIAAFGVAAAVSHGQNLLQNGNFSNGAENLDSWEAFASWTSSDGSSSFDSPWALVDAPVVAPGDGTAEFGMNDQLASDDPFWDGATQQMNFQTNLWTPDNNSGVTETVDLYGQEVTFSGNAEVSEPYAAGNTGEVFVQFLDQTFAGTFIELVDTSTLNPSGDFSITVDVPTNDIAQLNIVQFGFRNSGIEGTAGEMKVSNLSVTAVPEPSIFAVLTGLFGLGFVVWRRRKQG